MSPTTRRGLSILGAGVAVGLTADVLLPVAPWGLNLFLSVAALVAAGVWLVSRSDAAPSPDASWLALTALLLGAAFLRRDAELLQLLDFAALIGVLALAALAVRGASVRNLQVGAYIAAVFASGRNAVLGAPQLVGRDIEWRDLQVHGRLSRARGIALGAIIAAPLLLLFGALFAAADPVFSQTMRTVLNVDLQSATEHTVRTGALAWLAAGYLRGLTPLQAARAEPRLEPRSSALGGRVVPVVTALLLLNALFLFFVVIQLRYFFGGAALVEQVTGLTYAEYARQGFFQLVFASALVLPLMLGAEWGVRGAPAAALRRFRFASAGLLGLLAVVVASALERMRLYVAAFGLTEDRLYATAVMGYLVVLLAWLGWTVLRGRGERFAFGGLVQGLTLLAGLHVLNPDAFIVRHNLARPGTERPFDVEYASSLGADAAPVLFAALPRLSAEDGCVAAQRLAAWAKADADWRTWNWARARAARLGRDPRVTTALASCPNPQPPTPNPGS